ncbi:PilZ domain-containing protein [Sphingomonas jinjuensis]|nr:PilZ domain-containing protein [Sphingomonas jinjuensis]
MFAAEFESASGDGRRSPRVAPVALDAQLGIGGRALCKVVDISVSGAKIQTYSLLQRGSLIFLKLPGAGRVAAEVVWANDFLAGCEFRKPLGPRAYAALLAQTEV